ncbi:MAG: NAD+ synthase [Promethearchaeota archaeon]|nr:MAG: NAD+ synthase [Candidatus Lokiarchaeota archaeon]
MRDLDLKKLISEIQTWIKNYIFEAGAKGVVVGLSGGIDSAVTTSLCVNALGKENILGLGLPIESLPQDLSDAELVAKNLDISLLVLDLTSVYKELLKLLPSETKSNEMAISNIKPRLRMTTLYSIGQSKGYLVGGTGNRSEIAIGYFTKYGDGGVDFEPIGALYKGEVRKIAKLLNVPERIIKKPPSAGLWEGQTDEDEIGMSYDVLDEILYRLDHDLNLKGLDKKDIEKVRRMIKKTEHKKNLPPCFKVNQN